VWGTWRGGGFVYRGLCETGKEYSENRVSLSLYDSSVRGTWREDCFSGNSATYVKHVTEGFGNGTSLSL